MSSDRTVADISRELNDLFGRNARPYYPRELLRRGDRRDYDLSFLTEECRIYSWEFLSKWCDRIGQSTVRHDCFTFESNAPAPEKRDWLAKIATNPVTESFWFFTVSLPGQTSYRSRFSLQLYANEYEHEDSRLLLMTPREPMPELMPVFKRFWETVVGTISVFNGVELMVGESGRWGPRPVDEGGIRTGYRTDEQPTKITARFDSKLVTKTVMEIYKVIDQLAPELVAKENYPLVVFQVQPDSFDEVTKLLYEKDYYYRLLFIGGYRKRFSPEASDVGSAFPLEGYWRFPLMEVNHRGTGESDVSYVWTPTERFIEIASNLDRKKLRAFLRRKQFDCEFWDGVPGERWGLHALARPV